VAGIVSLYHDLSYDCCRRLNPSLQPANRKICGTFYISIRDSRVPGYLRLNRENSKNTVLLNEEGNFWNKTI
jgi:hypothetical protein